MAKEAVFNALRLKVASLNAGGFPGGVVPALYFDEAPQVTSTGGQVQVTTQGYAVTKHRGTRKRAYAFGGDERHDIDVDLEIFYPTLADAETAANAIAINGGTPAQKLGLDYGTLPALGVGYRLLAVRPTNSRAEKAGLGKTGVPVHQWTLSYRIEVVRMAQGT